MKLYATTTSERASKGQGGNKYLIIRIYNESKELEGCISILPDGTYKGFIATDNEKMQIKAENPLVVEQFSEMRHEEKGKKQKSKKGKYNICESFGCGNATEEPDGEYCAFH